jgi:hypothetical protein
LFLALLKGDTWAQIVKVGSSTWKDIRTELCSMDLITISKRKQTSEVVMEFKLPFPSLTTPNEPTGSFAEQAKKLQAELAKD